MNRLGKSLLYLIYVAVLIGLVVAIVLAFHSGKPKKPAVHKPATVNQPVASKPNPPAEPSKPIAPAAPKPSNSSGTTSNAATSTNSSAGNAQSANSGANSANLTNTGPGDTAGLFVGATVLGAFLYRGVLLRRIVRSS